MFWSDTCSPSFLRFLRGPLRNHTNGAYHWVLENGVPTDSKIYTYALAFVLLAYRSLSRTVQQVGTPIFSFIFQRKYSDFSS